MKSSALTEKARMSHDEVIATLTPKYVWWPLEGSEGERARRVLAQIMNLGTYEDIRAIEAVFDRNELIEVLAHAQAGWFSPRSWDFWRGRLSLSSDGSILTRPPRRSFDAGVLRTRT